MLLFRRESLQAESERSQLVPRVEEKNRTRSADAIHAQSTSCETNHATRMRCGGRRKARANREIFPRTPRIIVSYATRFRELILITRAVAGEPAAHTWAPRRSSSRGVAVAICATRTAVVRCWVLAGNKSVPR